MSDVKELAYGVKPAAFDKRDIFYTIIEPKVIEINDICEQHGIQLFAALCSSAWPNERGVGFHMHAYANIDPEFIVPMPIFIMHKIHQGEFQRAIELLTMMQMPHNYTKIDAKP